MVRGEGSFSENCKSGGRFFGGVYFFKVGVFFKDCFRLRFREGISGGGELSVISRSGDLQNNFCLSGSG